MTFDEYADQRCVAGLEEKMCKDFWNAALSAASRELRFVDFSESCLFPHQIVDSLKAE